jgi:spermidine synthase
LSFFYGLRRSRTGEFLPMNFATESAPSLDCPATEIKNERFSSKSWVRCTLLSFFFISGACGLIYQVVWLRELGLIFGNTTFAASTVIAGFMAGLGLGAWYFGKLIDKKHNPVRVYGLLEGGIALYSFLTPVLWMAIRAVYLGYYRFFEPSFFHISIVKLALSFLALLFPTFLMGGTFPVLSRYFIRQSSDVARPVSLLYAWNTLGAVLGVIFTGFFALYLLGVWQTLYLAGAMNLMIALACLKRRPQFSEETQKTDLDTSGPLTTFNRPETETTVQGGRLFRSALLLLFGVSGAVSMVYEIAWTRVLAIVLGSSVYAFSVMLATFLTGISIGSFLLSKFASKLRPGLFLFSLMQILTAGFVMLGLNRFDDMPFYFAKFYEMTGGNIWLIESGKFLFCAIGAIFACFIHLYHRTQAFGGEIGEAYGANTAGCIVGAVLTGFFIIPRIGIQHTLMAGAWTSAAVGAAAFLMRYWGGGTFRWKPVLAGTLASGFVLASAFAVQSWDTTLITSGAVVKPGMAKGYTKEQFMKAIRERDMLFYKEGAGSTVNVARMQDKLSLAVNGKVDASDGFDAYTQYLLGHLPMFYKSDAKSVLVIGLGSASTVAAVASHPVERIDAVEIEEAVLKGAEFFKRTNRNVLRDPRVKVTINDGRNFLLVSKRRYDVIISEPSNPWMAGVANLFSREHYQLMRNHLVSDGVVCQWLHAYSMSAEDLQMIIRTFTGVFKDTSLWMSQFPDILLIGRNQGGPIDFKAFNEIFSRPEIKQDFKPYGVETAEGLLAGFLLGDHDLRLMARGGRINSDNRPSLEFSAPRHLYDNTAKTNFDFIHAFKTQPYPVLINLDPPIGNNANFHARLGAGYLSQKLYQQAFEELRLAQAIEPNNVEALQNLGILSHLQKVEDNAAVLLSRAVQINPDLAPAHYYLGLILVKQSQLESAVAELSKAVQLDPSSTVYLKALGGALFQAKQYPIALRVYEIFLRIQGTDYEVLNKIADIVFMGDNLDEQRMAAETLMLTYPKDTAIYEKLGNLFEERKQLDMAYTVYDRYIQQIPKVPNGYVFMARLFAKKGDVAKMQYWLQKAVQVYPSIKKDPALTSLLRSVKP